MTTKERAIQIRREVHVIAGFLASPVGRQDPETICARRLAELWLAGEKGAGCRVQWKKVGNKTTFSVHIRRGDGSIEYPGA